MEVQRRPMRAARGSHTMSAEHPRARQRDCWCVRSSVLRGAKKRRVAKRTGRKLATSGKLSLSSSVR